MENKLWLVKRNASEYRKQQLAKGRSTFDLTAFNEWARGKSPEYIEMLARVPVDELNTFWQNDVAWAAMGLANPYVPENLTSAES
jgi:hypothetical protein